jgi:hypothetical protein
MWAPALSLFLPSENIHLRQGSSSYKGLEKFTLVLLLLGLFITQ